MKIGIITFHNVINYGGVLQAYALTRYLNNLGHKAECIDYRNELLDIKYSHKLYDSRKSILGNIKHFIKYYILSENKRKEKAFETFILKHMPLSEKVIHGESAVTFAKRYDVIIIGSDQVWNPQLLGGKLDDFLLASFASDEQIKIAYASSAGSYEFTQAEITQLTTELKTFKKIAVREVFLQKQLSGHLENVSVVADPTLLLDKEQWLDIADAPYRTLPEKYILIYTFDSNKTCYEIARQIQKLKGYTIISICKPNKHEYLKNAELAGENIGPAEFIYLFSKATYIVTNSFHGTIFSVIFSKPFFSIYKKNNPERVRNLLTNLDLIDRMVTEGFEVTEDRMLSLDYSKNSEKIKLVVANSRQFLRDALS